MGANAGGRRDLIRRRLIAGGIIAATLVGLLAATHVPKGPPPTDYQRELAALDGEIGATRSPAAAAGTGASPAPLPPGAAIQRAVLLQRRWGLTGDAADLTEAARLVATATVAGAASDQVSLFAAMLALDGHRLDDARRWLDGIRDRESWALAATEGDLAAQTGRLDDAAAAYARARASHAGWEVLARLANLRLLQGDVAGADQLYQQAEDDVGAKQMRTFAWLEVQRGRAAFSRGRLADAKLRYDRAARAYGGYWLVESRRAEVEAALGHGDEALSAYEHAAMVNENPDVAEATGELFTYLGRPVMAGLWFQRALAVYMASVKRGEAHYLHALAAYHADISGDAAQAVRLAEQDRALRPGVAAVRDQLGWALFRAGRIEDARRESAAALAIGAPDAHILYHAAMIALAAGRPAEGQQLLQRLTEQNPIYQKTFHAHL